MVLIAITGTPGVGKTAVCRIIGKKGYSVVYLGKVVKAHGELVSGFDRSRGVAEVDVDAANSYIKKKYRGLKPVFIDSHFSHLFDVKLCIVLRCSPEVLGRRLKRRKYPKAKLRENLEAEALDVITIESVQTHGKDKVYEIDTTGRSASSVAGTVLQILKTGNSKYREGRIDWSEEVLGWY